jgi:hypothetical protein
MLALITRLLTFRANASDYGSLERRHLALGLVLTWLVGFGRYWDNPRVELLQKAGLGSLIYVVVLSGLLWIIGVGLKPERWSYFNLLTFVTLTAVPGLLYAIPVEQFLTAEMARTVNLVFLTVVAGWRVALYGHYLKRYAELSPAALAIQLIFPLTLIVTALAALNLEQAVFDVMGGVRETTPADTAYAVIVGMTFFSVILFPLLLIAYVVAAVRRRRASTYAKRVT